MGRGTNGCTVLLCTLLCTVVAQKMNITQLPEGLLQRSLNIGIKTKEWKVIITVEEMSTEWDDVMRGVTSLACVNISRFYPWSRSQLQLLNQRVMQLQQSRSRQRRGLIDGLGKLAHLVFGLATDDEVDDLRQKIEDNRKWQRDMSVWTKDYVIVLNKTRSDMAKNREVINNITTQTVTFIEPPILL